MTSQTRPSTPHVQADPSGHVFDGAWWPAGRELADELPWLLAAWPAERGRVSRVLYSRPDWDDQPRTIGWDEGARTTKTGSAPGDDTHEPTLRALDGTTRNILVVPPGASEERAQSLIDAASDPGNRWTVDEFLAAVRADETAATTRQPSTVAAP